MNEILFEVLTRLVLAVVAVAGYYLTAWLRARFTTEQLTKAEDIARIAVVAVEQVMSKLEHSPAERFDAALIRAKELAARYGLVLTDEQWESMIESAVREWTKVWKTV